MKRRAHITESGTEQQLSEHLRNVAELTKEYAQKIGLPNLGYLTGLLHDMGKGTQAFDDYIVLVSKGEPWDESKLNHSAAGARYLTTLVSKKVDRLYERLALQLVCEAVMCHHSGLCDNYTNLSEDGYAKRIDTETEIYFEEAIAYFNNETATAEEVKVLFEQSVVEVEQLMKQKLIKCLGTAEMYYACGLIMKALFSCLIDADRYDTATFMDGNVLETQSDNQEVWNEFAMRLDDKIGNYLQVSELSVARKAISEQCRQAAELEGGVYTLSCPTGSGKTYSSMRFALHHAKRWKKRQIFYIIPFQSIIDQNAKAMRDIVGQEERNGSGIVELHSNLVNDNKNGDYKLLTERMDAPIILTTMVRFLNTFFAGGTQNSRPIHQFHNAVIIFDEIQTLPIRCVRMFNGLINFLSEVCNSTCILCTATQPLLNHPYEEIKPIRLHAPESLVAMKKSVLDVFQRVLPQDVRRNQGYSVQALSEFVLEQAKREGNCLVVMNTKSSALQLFQQIQEQEHSFSLFFLSTKLCPAHRKKIIQDIIERLKTERIIVVSTQLIEAGIDLSFCCAIRAIAGFDSWIQTAGRCNRNGEHERKCTYIVNPDFEQLSHLPDIKLGAECTHQVLNEYKDSPKEFEFDLFSDKTIERYFELYLSKQKGKMSYSRKKQNGSGTLYELLAGNEILHKATKNKLKDRYIEYILGQAFKTAGKEFEAIDQIGEAVIVPYREEGKAIIASLGAANGIWEKKELLQRAQQYAVNLTQQEIKQLSNAIAFSETMGVYVLNDLYYDPVMGVTGETSSRRELCGF